MMNAAYRFATLRPLASVSETNTNFDCINLILIYFPPGFELYNSDEAIVVREDKIGIACRRLSV
jgi:hypothetical protein